MELNDEQKRAIAKWVAENRSIGDIQKLLAQEYKLTMTYMDLRFLLIDLGVTVKDKEIKRAPPPDLSAPAAAPEAEEAYDDAMDAFPGAPGGKSSVSVTIDKVVKAGALVSGTVTFSDGVTATWMLDQFGRLGLEARKQGYRPSREDIQAFEVEIKRELQKRGF